MKKIWTKVKYMEIDLAHNLTYQNDIYDITYIC